MKMLINKAHPQIRITAPEITTEDAPYSNHQYVYWIPAINEMYNPTDWALVEEENKPKRKQSPALKKIVDNLTEEKLAKTRAEMKLEDAAEPVDLEEETKKWWKKHLGLKPENQLWMDAYQSVEFARHFYELGKKGGSK